MMFRYSRGIFQATHLTLTARAPAALYVSGLWAGGATELADCRARTVGGGKSLASLLSWEEGTNICRS